MTTGRRGFLSRTNTPTDGGSFKGSPTNVARVQRIAQFRQRHGEASADGFTQQVAEVKAQLRHHERFTRLVIHPGKTNSMLNTWDMVTGLALIYTALLTPFEAAFLPATIGPACWKDPWFGINRCLDGIFLCDMVLQFFLAYQQIDAFGGLVWVLDQRKIARHYLGSWFALDASTIFVPGAFDLSLAFQSADEDGNFDGFASDAGILRALRVIRLAKLVRLVRASRLYKRWQTRITLASGTQTVVQCALLLFVGAHWYACIIGMQTTLHGHPQMTWLGPERYGYCTENQTASAQLTWADDGAADDVRRAPALVQRARRLVDGGGGGKPWLENCAEMRLESWYIASFTWALMLITGTGGTDYYPSSASDGETLVVCVLVVCGALLWTYVLALFCDMATNSNPGLTQFRQLLDGLNLFIRTHQLPKEMARRLREYLHQQKPGQLGKYAERAIPVLSPTLQVEVILHVHRLWLESTWFLKGLETSCLVRLAREMQMQTLAPGEVAPLHNLCVPTRARHPRP